MRFVCGAASSAVLLITVIGFGSAVEVSAQEPTAPQEVVGAGDADVGAELFAADCRGCHSVSIAPTLRGVIDRPAASVAAFPGYSDALKAKVGVTWTAANLNAFLSDPQAFAPGGLMTKSVVDAQQRADIIAYLTALPPPRQ